MEFVQDSIWIKLAPVFIGSVLSGLGTLAIYILSGIKSDYKEHCTKFEQTAKEQWDIINDLRERVANIEGRLDGEE